MTKVIIGIDPHKLSATIESSTVRRSCSAGRFSTNHAGYTAMRAYARTWPERVWAIEGSNGAGRPQAKRLLEAGEHVVDVPAKLAARVRLFDTRPMPATPTRSLSAPRADGTAAPETHSPDAVGVFSLPEAAGDD